MYIELKYESTLEGLKKIFLDTGDKMQPCSQNNVSSLKDPEKLFEFGLLMLKMNEVWKALLAFKQAYEIKPYEARFLSYYGLCIAKVEKNATKAIPLCEKAIKKDFFHADLFCNLGKVYLQKGDRKKANKSFIKGLSIDKRNKELINELKEMGIRKRPLFTFLPRENIINHLGGFLYNRLLKRGKPVC